MVSLFKVASEVFLFALFVLTLLLNINLFISPPEIMANNQAPFCYAIHQILFGWLNLPQWIYTFIYIGVLYGSAVYFGIVVAKNRLVSNYTYLPALMFITLFSFFNQQTYPTLVFFGWYDNQNKEMLMMSGIAIWRKSNSELVKIKWVLLKDPEGKLEPVLLGCTDFETVPIPEIG